jgi:hypothetical protein
VRQLWQKVYDCSPEIAGTAQTAIADLATLYPIGSMGNLAVFVRLHEFAICQAKSKAVSTILKRPFI